MPKYYIKDGAESAVIDAETELEACEKAVLFFFNSFVVNGFFIVSEKGFDDHDEDKVYDSNTILDYIAKKQENRKKGGENT
jgi:hypothetical protein